MSSLPHLIAKSCNFVVSYLLVQLLSELNELKIIEFFWFTGGESRYSDGSTELNAIIKVTSIL